MPEPVQPVQPVQQIQQIQQIIQDRYINKKQLLDLLARKFLFGTYTVEVKFLYHLIHKSENYFTKVYLA